MKNDQRLMNNFFTLEQSDPHIKVPIIYSSNSKKYISIKINHDGVKVILPLLLQDVDDRYKPGIRSIVHKFLLEREPWIRKSLNKFVKPEIIIDTLSVPIFGETYSLHNIEANYDKIEINQNSIQIYSQNNQYQNILIKFLKDTLLSEAYKLAIIFREKHNLYFTGVKLIDNRNNWGSCNYLGELSFNWRLVFAPKNILEYLVVHEMCHLVEKNHSKRFWNLVMQDYPDYKSAILWLKQNGDRLNQYFR
ncbi:MULTISPECIES: M48 family metallopeptidase [unclassified Candidatus Tisiphia]|uniref:M48 family metallopeptidase n=1 Tax=unclassified Candidatus Tisiphia TaxID=2996318 RepID=UPI003CCB3706